MTTFEEWIQQKVSKRQFQSALEQSGDTARKGSAAAQARTIDRIYYLLGKKGANLRGQSDLASQIYRDLRDRATNWGAKAYPLTEKQIMVFVLEFEFMVFVREFESLAAEADAAEAFKAEHGYRW